MSDDLLVSRQDGVLLLTLNRPDALNALSLPMNEALQAALREAELDDAVGCVVLTGAGERAFCSGGDVKRMAAAGSQAAPSFERQLQELRRRVEVSRLLHELPKPTIAMVNGVAAGAGLSLALACDMRFVARRARMSTAFAKIGYSGDYGGHYYLHKLVGTARARELYFTAEMLDSPKIEALGLANRVIDDEKLVEETMAFAKTIAAGPRVAYALMKGNMKVAESGTLAEALENEAWRMVRARDTEDHKEAARAFVEKRKPVFKGR